MKKQMFILIGPSGAGKSTFLERALKDFPQLCDTTTYTSRPMRNGESEGKPYHFVSEERFKELIDQSFFIEWALGHDCFYGTPAHQIQDIWDQDRAVIMDVDVQGARTFKEKFPQAVTIFILAPSIDVLRQRLARRDGKNTKDLETRMKNAEAEMAQATGFDYQIVNEDFDVAYAEFRKMIEENLQSK